MVESNVDLEVILGKVQREMSSLNISELRKWPSIQAPIVDNFGSNILEKESIYLVDCYYYGIVVEQ